MTRVFADAFYWFALANPADQWHNATQEASTRLGNVAIITTDEVLTEFLTGMAGRGAFLRRQAVHIVRRILADTDVTVLPQSRESFLGGLALYEQRTDKGYSLTDCISMNVCRMEGISAVLTNDHHFAQEGFIVLITR